jgi:UDP-glucose-4-epimerase GalE
MHVLVTGGAGYVGSHAAKVLAASGMTPVCFDNLSRGNRWAARWGVFYQGDLGNRQQLDAVFRKHPIDAVLHFAAYAYVGESMERPGDYFANNVGNTINLLDTMNAHGVKTIVFSSTCSTYGIPDQLPITEDTEQRPVNPYGESKLAVEKILYWYGRTLGFSWAALRYFNAAGADPEGEIGESHTPETHLIPLAIQAALCQAGPLSVFGKDYETADGTAVRDYVHVADLAQAHVCALRYLQAGGPSRAFNLGTGSGHSVYQVIDAVERISGRKVPITLSPRREGDPPVLVADPRRAAQTLGWRPSHSSLDCIVQTAWRWHSSSHPSSSHPSYSHLRTEGSL